MPSQITSLAFTTRLPLAVMIVIGIKNWENRSSLPTPNRGRCGMSVSKNSDEQEYQNFLELTRRFSAELQSAIPAWEQVRDWRGKMVAVMDYEAGENPGPVIWDEGYRYWWRLSNVELLDCPYHVRGNVGMWNCNNGLLR